MGNLTLIMVRIVQIGVSLMIKIKADLVEVVDDNEI